MREVAQISRLLPREPNGAERLVGKCDERDRGRRLVIEERGEAPVDRCRGLAGKLLIDDGARNGGEMRSLRARLERSAPHLIDDGGKLGIDAAKMIDRAAVRGGLRHFRGRYRMGMRHAPREQHGDSVTTRGAAERPTTALRR
jgi:hypothetical protein